MNAKLPDKVALITGSGRRRVGNVVARGLARRGYAIGLHYHHSAESARETAADLAAGGTDCAVFQADVGDESAVERSVVQAVLFLIDNPFVTGACLPVDGGRTIYAGETRQRSRPI